MPDTHSIIASAIAGIREDGPADGGPEPTETVETTETAVADTSDADTGDGVAATDDGAAAPVAKVEKPEEKADNDDFDKEPEFTLDARGRKSVNKIPQPRVKKMVESSVKRAVEARDKEHTEKVKAYEGELQSTRAIGKIMDDDPSRFMAILANHDPRYKAYLESHQAAQAGGVKPGAARPAGADDPMPKADAQLPDGTPAYSPEGFQKFQEWQARQVENRVLEAVQKKYGWVDEARAANEKRDQDVKAMQSQIAEATTWDGFEEHRADILKALQDDSAEVAKNGGKHKFRDLGAAYRYVLKTKHEQAVAKLSTDRNKLREEVLAEMKARPNGTSTNATNTPVAKPVPGASNEPRDTKTIIRESIAKLRQ